jgi:hypothetical protein
VLLRHWRQAAAALAVLAGTSTAARAQAWQPDSGEGSVTVTYQGLFSRWHLDRDGRPYDKGSVTTNLATVGVDYGLSRLISIGGRVSFVASKHEGLDRLHGPLDTGAYHGTVQDARFTATFKLPERRGWVVAPYVGGIVPTHAYETHGHSAPGRRLRALQLGTWAGRDLGPWLPRAYLQGHASYSFVERIGDMSIDRSQFDFEGGYAVTHALTLSAAGTIQRTHGGLTFPLVHDEHFDDIFEFHDRVARDNYFVMTFGGTLAISKRSAIFASIVRTVSGQNTHRVQGVVAGVSRSFGGGLKLGLSPK